MLMLRLFEVGQQFDRSVRGRFDEGMRDSLYEYTQSACFFVGIVANVQPHLD